MKICITSRGNTLESQVDPGFGRCAYFIIADPETMDFEAIDNASTQSSGGAGIQSGQLMSAKGVKAVLTGNVGPNAFQTLKAAKIQIISGISGLVKDAINKYRNGEWESTGEPTVGSPSGMKGGN
ncbi:MAG: NifB/NifX family molybdenum-iron cluster-binding protein [Spirochaetales bacterium]|nr:NifB/NifX family molybdenum-iron cluster-binding protein [Spirochaetales bacterium]